MKWREQIMKSGSQASDKKNKRGKNVGNGTSHEVHKKRPENLYQNKTSAIAFLSCLLYGEIYFGPHSGFLHLRRQESVYYYYYYYYSYRDHLKESTKTKNRDDLKNFCD